MWRECVGYGATSFLHLDRVLIQKFINTLRRPDKCRFIPLHGILPSMRFPGPFAPLFGARVGEMLVRTLYTWLPASVRS